MYINIIVFFLITFILITTKSSLVYKHTKKEELFLNYKKLIIIVFGSTLLWNIFYSRFIIKNY
jgi:hypothetical protein